jgi:hypothetical protein
MLPLIPNEPRIDVVGHHALAIAHEHLSWEDDAELSECIHSTIDCDRSTTLLRNDVVSDRRAVF